MNRQTITESIIILNIGIGQPGTLGIEYEYVVSDPMWADLADTKGQVLVMVPCRF